MTQYDRANPGPPGIYEFNDGKQYFRKRDDKGWYEAYYSDTTIEHALCRVRHLAVPSEYWGTQVKNVFFVADLNGNPVERQEARRIGDPLWAELPRLKQMELF